MTVHTLGVRAADLGTVTFVQHALAGDLETRAEALVLLASRPTGVSEVEARRTQHLVLTLAPSWTPSLWEDLVRYCDQFDDVCRQIGVLEDDPDAIDTYIEGPIRDRAQYRETVLEDLRSDREHLRAEKMTVARWMVACSGGAA